VNRKPSSEPRQAHEFDWTVTEAMRHVAKERDWPNEKALAELDRAIGAADLPYMAFEKIDGRLEGERPGKGTYWRSEVSLRLVEGDSGREVQTWPARACGFDPLKFEFRLPSKAVRSLCNSKAPPAALGGDAGSRMQRLIRRLCNEQWPQGYDDVETRHIITTISPKLKSMGIGIPERSLWLRALRRKKQV
jgi:hypothetical protein